jgi:hypothetical protein
VSSLHSCGPLAYSDIECAKQLLYVVDDHVWGMKIATLEESADFATLDNEKLFSKIKYHKLSRKGRPNHDASLTSKALIISARVDGHDANPTNTTVSSALKFVLSSLSAASDEQYESIPDDEIALLARKFRYLHMFRKERRRSPRSFFECGDTTHFIADYPMRKKPDSSNKKKKEEEEKKFQKMMSRACTALSVLDFSSETAPTQRRMRSPSPKKVTSPAFASWENLLDTSLTLTPM